ncbi:MAG: hypothetical protein ACE5F6_08220 [Anaerolineae bacterium]
MTTGTILTLCLVALLAVPPLAAGHLQDASWSVNVPVSGPDAVPHGPVVALNSAGQAYAAWQDARSGPARGIYVASRPAGAAWTTPLKIPGSDAGNPGSPTIATGPGNEVYVAWVNGFPETRADIQFAWSSDGGHTWQGPANVNTDPQDIAGHPDLAADSQSNVHLVWDDLAVFGDPHSRDVKWSVRRAGQDTWTDPAVVHPDVEVLTEQARPAITADGAGNVYAIWEDARHGPADAEAVYAARLPVASVAWEPGRRVDQRPGQPNARPGIAAGPDGTVYAVWDAGAAGEIYAATLQPGAEAWEGPTRVRKVENGKWKGERGEGKREKGKGKREKGKGKRERGKGKRERGKGEKEVEEWAGGTGVPHVAVDRHGIAYVVWQDSRSGDQDVYAAVRWPGATRWGQNMRVNDDAGTATQESPAIAAGKAGLVVVVWTDQRQSTSGAIYASQLEPAIHSVRLPFLARLSVISDQWAVISNQ